MHAAWLLLAGLPAVSVPAGHKEHVLLPAELYELAGHAVRIKLLMPALREPVRLPLRPSLAKRKTHQRRVRPMC